MILPTSRDHYALPSLQVGRSARTARSGGTTAAAILSDFGIFRRSRLGAAGRSLRNRHRAGAADRPSGRAARSSPGEPRLRDAADHGLSPVAGRTASRDDLAARNSTRSIRAPARAALGVVRVGAPRIHAWLYRDSFATPVSVYHGC